jgi:hypothetical protein
MFDDNADDLFDAAPAAAFFDTDPRSIDDRPSRFEVAAARHRRDVLKARAARRHRPEAGWRSHLAVDILSGAMPDWSEDNLSSRFGRIAAAERRAALGLPPEEGDLG